MEEHFWKVYRKSLQKWKEAQNVADRKVVDLIKSKEIANDGDQWTIFADWQKSQLASTILKSEIRAK
eukprot:5039998-Ditylum_brightwellii.AAC.1